VVALPLPPLEEGALVRGLVAGDPAAVGELFDRHQGLVRSMLTRTLGSVVDLDDLVQETFLLVIRRSSTLRDPRALRSFVVGVAIRVARNELRKRAVRRWVGLGGDTPVEGLCSPHDPVLADSVRRLYRALDRLEPEGRVLFVLRRVEGHELPELAEATGLSLSTVKRRLARAEARFEALCKADPVLRERLPSETPAP